MHDSQSQEITRLLSEFASGDEQARERLLPLVYDELRRQAQWQRSRQRPFETLNTTALVHETFLKLAGRANAGWENCLHFFRVAGRAMRDILVDYARRQRAAKRGGDQVDLPLDAAGDLPEVKDEEILAVHETLKRLEKLDPRQSKVVELRYFVGLSILETAEVLEISPATVRRDWATARAWLQREIERGA